MEDCTIQRMEEHGTTAVRCLRQANWYDTYSSIAQDELYGSQQSLLPRAPLPTYQSPLAFRESHVGTQSQNGAGVTQPEPAYTHHGAVNLGRSEKRLSIITVGLPPQSTTSRAMPASSDASSGVSISREPTPEPVKTMLAKQPPGTYVYVTHTSWSNTSQGSSLIDCTQAQKRHAYALEPMDSFADRIASGTELDSFVERYPLPAVQGYETWNQMRYGFFSVYRRLHVLVLLINVAAIFATIAITSIRPGWMTYGSAVTAAGANLFVSAVCRFEHFINLLFSLACSLPHRTPLLIRRHAAKVYSYGGVHSGCGIAALFWYIFFAVLATSQFTDSTVPEQYALIGSTAAVLFMLTLVIVMAHPLIRQRRHDWWELAHRFGAWAAVGLVWAQAIVLSVVAARQADQHSALILVKTPTFWFLIFITAIVIHPWLYLRHRKVEAEKLSSHALRLHIPNKKLGTCEAIKLSDAPLTENHGFACIPNANGEKGFSIIVSNAGDWTKDIINNPPSKIWFRGAPTAGVMKVALMFKPLVIVATGSAIGPCLSFLQSNPGFPVRLIWSARFPEATYGLKIMEAALEADRDAIIIDTNQTGHPDLTALTYALYREIRAEAVVLISNPKVTKQVVYALETREVPIFGAIFDS